MNFFGMPACAGTAFVRIAHKTGAAVIPGYALWSDIERNDTSSAFIPSSNSPEISGRHPVGTHYLEEVIREYPDQWLWIHRRWKTRPPGSPSFY